MRRRLAAVLLVVSAVAGCGITPTEPFLYGLPPRSPVTGVQLHLLFGGDAFEVLRPGPDSLGAAERLDLLFAGPTEAEFLAGVGTAVPAGYRRAGPVVEREAGRFAVVVDREDDRVPDLDARAGGQIACTVLPGVQRAGSTFDGVVVVLGASGRELGPYRCEPVIPPSRR
ncbi:hypothetical protein [Umezawaea sp.]|uniref:hypothetical protein n=1 Tax=Umezawaea sp. TaxID=1955258 RepID=UPI002ED4DEC6